MSAPLLAILSLGCVDPADKPPADEDPTDELPDEDTDVPPVDDTGADDTDTDDTGSDDTGDTGPDTAFTAVFADASAADLRAAFSIGSGIIVLQAELAQMSADFDARMFDSGDGCPTYTVLGEGPLRVQYDGGAGCTTTGGITYAGTAEATNPVFFDAEHDGGAMGTTFDGFRVATESSSTEIDGTWSQTAAAWGVDGSSTADLSLVLSGQLWTVHGTWSATYDGDDVQVTCAADHVGSVAGLGTFGVRCEMVNFGTERGHGWVELVGADTLRVDVARDADGCYPTTVNGVDAAPLCPDAPAEEEDGTELDSDVFHSYSREAEDGTLSFTLGTRPGEVARADVAIAGTLGPIEVHPFAPDAATTDAMMDGWRVDLEEDGTYVSGVSTALFPADLRDAAVVVFAYDTAGALIGCEVPSFDEDPGRIDVSACPRK